MTNKNIVHGWFPGDRPRYGIISFLVPMQNTNGTIEYIPINKTAPKPIWNNGVEISSYFHIGASTVLKNIPDHLYIVGPTYCKNGISTDSRVTITGKALASVPELDGKLNWRKATFEYFEDAMNRELQEEVGLSIKKEYMDTVRTNTILMKSKRSTVATIAVTLNMLELYNPLTMEKSVFVNKDEEILKDNRNFRVQIILVIEKDEIDKLREITNRRYANDTNSITGLCAIPRSRFTARSMRDHCEIIFDDFKVHNKKHLTVVPQNIIFAKGPPSNGDKGFNHVRNSQN